MFHYVFVMSQYSLIQKQALSEAINFPKIVSQYTSPLISYGYTGTITYDILASRVSQLPETSQSDILEIRAMKMALFPTLYVDEYNPEVFINLDDVPLKRRKSKMS